VGNETVQDPKARRESKPFPGRFLPQLPESVRLSAPPLGHDFANGLPCGPVSSKNNKIGTGSAPKSKIQRFWLRQNDDLL
jgi:hypothetical protein